MSAETTPSIEQAAQPPVADSAPAEAPQPEAPAAAEPSPPQAPDERLQRGWSDLVKRDQELLQRQQQVRQSERELEHVKRAMASASTDPIAAIRALGIDPAKALEAYWGADLLPKKEKDPMVEYEAKLREVTERLTRTEQWAQQAYGTANRYREHSELAKAIGAAKEYDAVQAELDAKGEAFLDELHAVREQHYQAYGSRPSIKDTLHMANETLIERMAEAYERYSRVPSLQAKLKKTAPAQVKPAEAKKQVTTLQASDGATDGFDEEAVKNMPAEQRRELAKKFFRQAFNKS